MRHGLVRLLLVLLPAALGIAAWLTFRLGWSNDFIVYLRANLGLLLLLGGIVLSFLLAIGFGLYWSLEVRSSRGAEALRERSLAEHQQFLRRLDHELKNPLTALQVDLANLAELTGAPASESPTESPLERIRLEISRLNEMVLQLRKLADLRTRPVEQIPVRLDELLEDLVNDYSASRLNLSLNVPRMPWPLPEVRGDPDLLYLALRNILGNAVKFTRPEDPIQVRAFEDTGHIVVEVADQGMGIPADEMSHVMEELYRGKNARGLPGSGLGLALVRAIVQRHGGEVLLRSRVNQGTVIALRLPRA